MTAPDKPPFGGSGCLRMLFAFNPGRLLARTRDLSYGPGTASSPEAVRCTRPPPTGRVSVARWWGRASRFNTATGHHRVFDRTHALSYWGSFNALATFLHPRCRQHPSNERRRSQQRRLVCPLLPLPLSASATRTMYRGASVASSSRRVLSRWRPGEYVSSTIPAVAEPVEPA